MQEKDESLMAQKKMSDGKKEEISQVHILNIWIRGNYSIPVVSWAKLSTARMFNPQKNVSSKETMHALPITLNN